MEFSNAFSLNIAFLAGWLWASHICIDVDTISLLPPCLCGYELLTFDFDFDIATAMPACLPKHFSRVLVAFMLPPCCCAAFLVVDSLPVFLISILISEPPIRQTLYFLLSGAPAL